MRQVYMVHSLRVSLYLGLCPCLCIVMAHIWNRQLSANLFTPCPENMFCMNGQVKLYKHPTRHTPTLILRLCLYNIIYNAYSMSSLWNNIKNCCFLLSFALGSKETILSPRVISFTFFSQIMRIFRYLLFIGILFIFKYFIIIFYNNVLYSIF